MFGRGNATAGNFTKHARAEQRHANISSAFVAKHGAVLRLIKRMGCKGASAERSWLGAGAQAAAGTRAMGRVVLGASCTPGAGLRHRTGRGDREGRLQPGTAGRSPVRGLAAAAARSPPLSFLVSSLIDTNGRLAGGLGMTLLSVTLPI